MSVPNQTPYNIYTANGLTTVFAYEFYLISASDIQVTINGNEVTSGYTVSGVGNTGGGEVTFLTAPANGATVIFERVTPTYRLTDYQDNGDLLADTVNKDFDRIWMAIQRAFIYLGVALTRPLFGGGPFNANGYRIANLADPINDQDAATKKFVVENGKTNLVRTLRVPESTVAALPYISGRKNKILAFNDQGNPIAVLPESGSAADVLIELVASDGVSRIGGLPFVTPEMFGSSRGDITHDEAFRLMLAAAAVHPTRTAWAPGDYELFDNHILPQGVTLIIDGVIKHNPVGDFTWSESNRRSDYSLFTVTESYVAIKGSGRIENKYEAVSVDAGGDNFKYEGVTISNPDRSKSVGLSIYNVTNVSVLNCLIANNGSKGTYVNSSSTGITGRYGNGIDAGGIRGLTVRGLSLIDNGGNGFWCYGVGDLTFTTNWCLMNGVSGMQYGPHPDYDGVNISYNICRENAADGIDINYTGSSPVPIAGVFNGNICRRNGFFNSDTTKPTADGSGITLRNVTDYICADNMMRDNNGVGIYCTYAADSHVHDNVIINRITLSAGMYQGFASTDVNVHDNRFITLGTCYQEGGSMPVAQPAFHHNKLTSIQAQTVSLPSNTQTDRIWGQNHHKTPNVINFWFSVKDEVVRYTGSTGRAVYINTSFGKIRYLKVAGSTSGDLIYIDGGAKNTFSGLEANNTGSGRAVYANNSARLKFADSLIQCAAGNALFCYAGDTVELESCDVVGTTAISAPLPSSGNAPTIYKSGVNLISGTVSTANPVKQVTYS